jgi:hypothetical protein
MTESRFKTRVKGKEQTRNSLTAKGVGYNKVRSKFLKGPDGYGRVISVAREKLLEKSGGKDPGKDVVARHLKPGAHFEKDGGAAKWGSRGDNTAESNKFRAKHRLRNGGKDWGKK